MSGFHGRYRDFDDKELELEIYVFLDEASKIYDMFTGLVAHNGNM